MNSRIINLLGKLCLNDRIWNKNTKLNIEDLLHLDLKLSREILKDEKEKSKLWLMKALNNLKIGKIC